MNDIFFFGIISLVIDLDKVYLDNFVLEDYDEFDYNHKCTIMELSNDIDARNYLYDVKWKMDAVKRRSEDNPLNLAYVAFYNDYPIGIITLSYINREYYISYGILPEYRKQYLASLLLQEFSEYLFTTYPEIDALNLSIVEKNTGSVHTAKRVGYERITNPRYSMKR